MRPPVETKIITVDAARSKEAQDALWKHIVKWLDEFSAQDGFREWKGKHIIATLASGFVPNVEAVSIEDFPISDKFAREQEIVSGYIEIQSSVLSVRECQFYYRKYPFNHKNVSREAHLRTCCELFFGRVYQFRERFFKQIKRVQRRSRRQILDADGLLEQFQKRFKSVINARNDVSHHKAYDDVHLSAVGLGDMLSSADTELSHLRLSRWSVGKITKYWVKQVTDAADELDIFVGILAIAMLSLCNFLPEIQET